MPELNALPASRHVQRLFKNAQVTPEFGLTLVALVLWAAENLAGDPGWAERAVGAALGAEQDDPQATFWNLQQGTSFETSTLSEAGLFMLQHLADTIRR